MHLSHYKMDVVTWEKCLSKKCLIARQWICAKKYLENRNSKRIELLSRMNYVRHIFVFMWKMDQVRLIHFSSFQLFSCAYKIISGLELRKSSVPNKSIHPMNTVLYHLKVNDSNVSVCKSCFLATFNQTRRFKKTVIERMLQISMGLQWGLSGLLDHGFMSYDFDEL